MSTDAFDNIKPGDYVRVVDTIWVTPKRGTKATMMKASVAESKRKQLGIRDPRIGEVKRNEVMRVDHINGPLAVLRTRHGKPAHALLANCTKTDDPHWGGYRTKDPNQMEFFGD